VRNLFRKNNKENVANLLEETVKLLREKAESMKGSFKDADTAINSFIRAARDESESFIRPDDNTITAFLLGYANEEQQNEVAEALGGSRHFRLEIIQLAKDIDAVKSVKPEQEDSVDQKLVEVKHETAQLSANLHKFRYEMGEGIDSVEQKIEALWQRLARLDSNIKSLQVPAADNRQYIDQKFSELRQELIDTITKIVTKNMYGRMATWPIPKKDKK
jgi:DNA anti-recombination protein RmuC